MALALIGLVPNLPAEGGARFTVSTPSFNFGTVMEDEPVTNTFQIENVGQETLEITNVWVTAPLFFKNVRKQILPGERRDISISLGTPRSPGDYEGWVEVAFGNSGLTNLIFDVRGKIRPRIEFLPFPAFFVATARGQTKQASIEIINHETEPLYIGQVEHASKRFTTELNTVELGRRYTLTLTLDGNSPPGKATDTIKLVTSSKTKPLLILQANTYIKDRVYTFPDTVDVGRILVRDLKANPSLTNYLSQTLMVYQQGGTNFEVVARTDAPFLRLSSERSKGLDQYQITLDMIPERLTNGAWTAGS